MLIHDHTHVGAPIEKLHFCSTNGAILDLWMKIMSLRQSTVIFLILVVDLHVPESVFIHDFRCSDSKSSFFKMAPDIRHLELLGENDVKMAN